MTESKTQAGSTFQAVTFEVSGKTYGITILSLEEIIPMVALTPVPQAPEGIEGMVNLRGEVIPVSDLAKQFGGKREGYAAGTRILIVHANGRKIGFIVDGVQAIKLFHEDALHPPVIDSKQAKFITGVVKLESGEMIQMVAFDRVLQPEVVQQLDPNKRTSA